MMRRRLDMSFPHPSPLPGGEGAKGASLIASRGRGGLSWYLCSRRGEGGYTVPSRVRRTRFKAYMLMRVRSGLPRPAKLYSRV
jgi:hypothetical protein